VKALRSPEDIRALSQSWRATGQKVGFVPTMGALHEGHLSLVRRAGDENDKVIVSVFVNPAQFGRGEDFERYPRDLERDRELLGGEGCDALFTPGIEEMYGGGGTDLSSGRRTFVEVGALGERWEGEARPGHFRGVATVVAMLFNATVPHRVYFGEKDYQQLKVVEGLVRDLLFGAEIVGCPTVREPDGLAMSSRNTYLSEEERSAAPMLFQALRTAAVMAEGGERDPENLVRAVRGVFEAQPLVDLEYAAVVDAETLDPLEALAGRPVRAILAAHVGATRLIDNVELRSS